MSKVRLLAAIAAASVLAVSLFAAPAYAVSSFDDTVELGINEVSFTDSGVFRSKLVTEAVFDELVVNSSDPACQAGYAGYEDADIRGAFQEVSAYTYESMQYGTVTFFWADTSIPENVLSAQDDGTLRYLGLDTSYLTDAGTIVFSFGYVNGDGPLVVADCFNGNDSIMSVPIYDFALNAYGLYASDPATYHSHWHKPLFLEGDVVYPTGYEGITIPSSYELNPKYVAMGDSFSSGEGNEPFELGTDIDDVNECHRSTQAYPRLLQNDPDLDLGSMAFVACSGALTSNVWGLGPGSGHYNELAQISALTDQTEIITITIGGNDTGFANTIRQCADPSAEPSNLSSEQKCQDSRAEMWDYLDNEGLLNDVGVTLLHIDTMTGSEIPVYVGGYADPLPSDLSVNCNWGPGGASDVIVRPITTQERLDFAAITAEINDQISQAVQEFPQMTFVDVQQRFSGHDSCAEQPWFIAISYPDNQEYSYHPNQSGQLAYYQAFKEAIQG